MEDKAIPFYERERKSLSFEQLLNYSSSIQFAVFQQLRNKLRLAVTWCQSNHVPIQSIVRCHS